MSIANEILMHLRSIRNHKNEVSLHEPVGTDKDGNEMSLLDLLSRDGEDISENIELSEEARELWDIIKILDEKERYVIRFRYGLGLLDRKTQREVAREMNISRSYVSRIEKKAMRKLFHEMEKRGIKR